MTALLVVALCAACSTEPVGPGPRDPAVSLDANVLGSRKGGPGPTSWRQDTTVAVGLYDAIWGSDAANIFSLSGTLGIIVHYDGSRWSTMSSGTGNGLNSI